MSDAVVSDEQRELLSSPRNAGAGVYGGGGYDEDMFDGDCPTQQEEYRLARVRSRRMKLFRFILVALSVAVAASAMVSSVGGVLRGKTSTKMRCAQTIGESVLSSMDLGANPCVDFYEYACGSWLRKKTIPPYRTSYSRSFSSVAENIQKELRELLEVDLQDDEHPNAIAGRFYTSCMNGMAIGPLDVRILGRFRPFFNGLKTAKSLSSALANLHGVLSAGMFDIDVGVDENYPDRYAVLFGQGGLGLSHPNKYTSEKMSDLKVRRAYIKLIEGHLRVCMKANLLKSRNIEELAKKTFDFEKSLASIHKPPEELRDPTKLYNPMKLESFPEEIFIHTYLKDIGIDKNKINSTIIVEDPKYLLGIANMMARASRNTDYREAVKGYLGFHLIRHFASKGVMGEELYEDTFRFDMITNGVKKMSEKWKRCQSLTSRNMGDALGEAFVKKLFPSSRKESVEKLAEAITHQFGKSLSHQEWMDSTTRSKAQEKLKAMNWKVGYTKKFDKYPGVVIRKYKRDFAENVLYSMEYRKQFSIRRLGNPIDKTEWFMHAYETNAYYSLPRNEMVFPAGILQQSFFSDLYPDAMNFGGIGVVIGHEMSHAFDDSGRKFDKDGRLTQWWSPASAKKYEEKAQCFVDLFNGYKPRSVATYVKGNLTLGENLADTNGVKVAFEAFKNTGENNFDPNARAPIPVLAEELSNHQLFFVAYAQTWCYKWRPKALELAMLTDPHSPGQFRVQGPLSQLEEFASTFKCKTGTSYNPEKRCKLW